MTRASINASEHVYNTCTGLIQLFCGGETARYDAHENYVHRGKLSCQNEFESIQPFWKQNMIWRENRICLINIVATMPAQSIPSLIAITPHVIANASIRCYSSHPPSCASCTPLAASHFSAPEGVCHAGERLDKKADASKKIWNTNTHVVR